MRVVATCFITFLAAACGNVSGFPDGGTTDSLTFDTAPTIDANPRGLVKVTVLDSQGTGAPVTGIPVVFVEPDGTVAARVATDAMGKAQAEVLPGSSVTAVYVNGTNNHEMDTITGVKIGDDIVITPSLNGSPAGNFTVNFPAYAGAVYYYVGTPCGIQYVSVPAGNPPYQYQAPMYQYCKPATTMTVSVWAFTNAGVAGYLDKPNVMFSAGATALTGTWQAMQNYTANFTNIPAEVMYLNHNRFSPDTAGYSVANGSMVTSPSMTLTMAGPTGSSAVAQTRVQRATYEQQQSIYQPTAGNALSYSLDVGANLLPWIAQPALDVTTGIIKVTTDGTGTGDLVRIAVGYTRAGATTTDYFHWVVYGAAATDITLPQMPIEVGDVNPKATDAVQTYNSEAAIGDADAITGYDQVREHACQIYLASMAPNGNLQLGMSNLLRVSYYYPAN